MPAFLSAPDDLVQQLDDQAAPVSVLAKIQAVADIDLASTAGTV